MPDITIPAGSWRPAGEWDGPPLGRDLTMQATGVMDAPGEGWLTVVGCRTCEPDESARQPVTVQVDADALPPELRIAPGGAR